MSIPLLNKRRGKIRVEQEDIYPSRHVFGARDSPSVALKAPKKMIECLDPKPEENIN